MLPTDLRQAEVTAAIVKARRQEETIPERSQSWTGFVSDEVMKTEDSSFMCTGSCLPNHCGGQVEQHVSRSERKRIGYWRHSCQSGKQQNELPVSL